MADNLALAPQPTTAGGAYRWRWLAFVVVLLASIMNLLDTLVTNIAAPSIRAELGGGPALIQWLGAGYTLALAAGLITGGRLGDLYGRKPVFLVGAVGFTMTSLVCALAASPGMLIGARVAQGLFGAVMLPQGLGVIRSVFPPRELGTAFGVFGPAMGLASVAGPVLAGGLISADLWGTGWRMIFLINLPLGLFAVVAGARFLPAGRESAARRLDLPGAVLAAVAALLLVYPVVQGRELDWPAWVFLLIALALVLFVGFARYEAGVQRRGGDPLIVPTLFGNRAFTGGLATGLAIFTSMVGFALVFAVFLQAGLGFSPLKAGLTVLPQALGSLVGFAATAVGLTQRLGRRSLQLGTLLMISGVLGVFLVLRIEGADVSPWHFAPMLLIYGAGLGLFLSPFFDIVLAGVRPAEYGSASGTLNAMQQLGGAVGAAVLGTVFFSLLGGQVAQAVDADAATLRSRLAAVGVTAPEQQRIVDGLRACGRENADATDPDAVPAACRRLGDEVTRAAGATSDGAAVTATVGEAGRDATQGGFAAALRGTIWAAVGLLATAFALTFLLPPYARRQQPARAGDGPTGQETGSAS
ncbi:MFS transporter [Micromonospora sp. NPDC049301]|uniref:MFS transporter n=1 Tax=Micromonospora sp. NPDC049301 TaxID=3155723 RepID=UPI00343B56A7